MTEAKIWTFLYGSYMNFDVLKEVNLVRTNGRSRGFTGMRSLFCQPHSFRS
jgi:hypothetical protein